MNTFIPLLTPGIILLLFVAILFVIRPLITIIHEGGHACASLLLTKADVSVYIGTYGNQEKCISVKAGRLTIWFNKNPFRWWGGLCVPGATIASLQERILIVLAGPVATLLLGLALIIYFLILKPEGPSAAFLVVSATYLVFSFVGNILPRDKAIAVSGGNLIYNDGTQLRILLNERRMPPAYFELLKQFEDAQYEVVATNAEKLIAGKVKNEAVYRMAVSSCIQIKDYTRAEAWQKAQMERFGRLNTHDRINKAVLKIAFGQHEQAIGYLKHLLELYGDNKFNLNNLGYVLTLEGRYEEAIPYIDKALKIDPEFGYSYSNRAYAYLRMGQQADGKKDNDKALELDARNAHAWRNDGLYYLNQGLHKMALSSFEKAMSLNGDVKGLDQLLIESRKGLTSYG